MNNPSEDGMREKALAIASEIHGFAMPVCFLEKCDSCKSIADALESFAREMCKLQFIGDRDCYEKRIIQARKEALEEIYQLIYCKIGAETTATEIAPMIRSLISKDGGQKS